MNENIVHFINTEAFPENLAIFERRIQKKPTSDRQRMKIITELIELYDAINLIGCDQITDQVFSLLESGATDQAFTMYEQNIKDTMKSELADVVIATLTLKAINQDPVYAPKKIYVPYGKTFIQMIELVANFTSADAILDWCILFAASHCINLAPQIRLKLMYNGWRKDWENA